MKQMSIRIEKRFINKATTVGNPKSKKSRYYKSHREQYEHDKRSEIMENGYLKFPDKTSTNIFKDFNNTGGNTPDEIVENSNKLVDIAKADYKENSYRNRNMRKNWKPIINGLISFSEDFHIDDEKNRQDQFSSVENFIIERFGKDAVVYINQQNDEKSLHYSFSVLNYDFRTHKTVGKYIDTSKLQTEISEWLKKDNQNYDHVRGTKDTNAKNVPLALHLKNEAKQAEIISKKGIITNIHITKQVCKEFLEDVNIEDEHWNERDIKDIKKITEMLYKLEDRQYPSTLKRALQQTRVANKCIRNLYKSQSKIIKELKNEIKEFEEIQSDQMVEIHSNTNTLDEQGSEIMAQRTEIAHIEDIKTKWDKNPMEETKAIFAQYCKSVGKQDKISGKDSPEDFLGLLPQEYLDYGIILLSDNNYASRDLNKTYGQLTEQAKRRRSSMNNNKV